MRKFFCFDKISISTNPRKLKKFEEKSGKITKKSRNDRKEVENYDQSKDTKKNLGKISEESTGITLTERFPQNRRSPFPLVSSLSITKLFILKLSLSSFVSLFSYGSLFFFFWWEVSPSNHSKNAFYTS